MKKPMYLVAGLGKTGYSIANYLVRQGRPFIAFDTRQEVEGLDEFKHRYPDVTVYLHDLPASVYPQLSTIIVSPGISLEEPFLQTAKAYNLPIYGDIECFAQEVRAPVISITGTNGKSTVTTLVGEMAKQAGIKVAVAGNIGSPVLERLSESQDIELWVLELSSFQLELTHSLVSKAAVLLNITPDHLDRHHTMDAYISAKQRVYRAAEILVYNRQDVNTIPQHQNLKQNTWISYGLDKPASGQWGILEQGGQTYLAHGDECVLPVEALRIKGTHNWQNALAAAALATSVGISYATIRTVLTQFAGLPHRCQWVRTLDKVLWINDSKGTNVGATESAIAGIGGAMSGRIVLIAGGIGKGADFSILRTVVAKHVRSVVLMGQDADKIAEGLSGVVPLMKVDTIEEAVQQAKSIAEPGDVVLLSPSCASFDMFQDFNHRGEVFTQLVEQL